MNCTRMFDRRSSAARFTPPTASIAMWTCALVLLSCISMTSMAWAELILNEVLSAPSTDWNGDGEVDFKNDEWVEILNTGPSTASLDELYLRDGTGDTYHYGFSGVLGPGEVRVVYGHEAVAWQAANDAGSSGLSLNNGGDTLELWRDSTDPRVLEAVDVITIPGHGAASDRSVGRREADLEWVLFDALNPYSGELLPVPTGCTPSPGGVNSCNTVPLPSKSVGEVKSRYGTSP